MSFKDLTLTDSHNLLHCVPHGFGLLILSFGVDQFKPELSVHYLQCRQNEVF